MIGFQLAGKIYITQKVPEIFNYTTINGCNRRVTKNNLVTILSIIEDLVHRRLKCRKKSDFMETRSFFAKITSCNFTSTLNYCN